MWTEHILNPKLISSLFKGEIPSLKQIKMYETSVMFGGTVQCKMHFDLKDFLAEAPIKWVQSKYNTVGMSLNLIDADIKHFSVCGGEMVGDLSIDFLDSAFLVEFSTDKSGMIFSAIAKWINVDKVEGYISSQMH